MQISVLDLEPGIIAFYAGRDGTRFGDGPNWVDDGALSLGIASYAFVVGDSALVYDTGISVAWGQFVLDEVRRRGASAIQVLLSHHHPDHIAGNEAFADCEIIASDRTTTLLAQQRSKLEDGTQQGPPAIAPLVMPTSGFRERLDLRVGEGAEAIDLKVLEFNIHSSDGNVIWIPSRGLLLAGDTLEDTVTYVVEPEHLEVHLDELARLRSLGVQRIQPNHGDPELIAAGGYSPQFIDATGQYIRYLLSDVAVADPRSLAEIVADLPDGSALRYFSGYDAIHQHNLAAVAGRSAG